MIWCAVNTKPQKEEYAAKQLEMKGLKIFLPRIEVTRKRGTKKMQLLDPLFPGYLFVRLAQAPKYVSQVNWTPGVRRLLCCGETPVPVPDEAINLIQQRLNLRTQATSQVEHEFAPGTQVCIINGPLAGLLGVVDKPMTGKGRVRVLLQFLRQVTPVELDITDLDKVRTTA